MTVLTETITARDPLGWTFTPLGRLIGHLIAMWRQRRENRIARNAFRNLERLDDAMLCDIGMTRADIAWGLSLPLNRNAALEVHKRTRKQRFTH